MTKQSILDNLIKRAEEIKTNNETEESASPGCSHKNNGDHSHTLTVDENYEPAKDYKQELTNIMENRLKEVIAENYDPYFYSKKELASTLEISYEYLEKRILAISVQNNSTHTTNENPCVKMANIINRMNLTIHGHSSYLPRNTSVTGRALDFVHKHSDSPKSISIVSQSKCELKHTQAENGSVCSPFMYVNSFKAQADDGKKYYPVTGDEIPVEEPVEVPDKEEDKEESKQQLRTLQLPLGDINDPELSTGFYRHNDVKAKELTGDTLFININEGSDVKQDIYNVRLNKIFKRHRVNNNSAWSGWAELRVE